MRTFHELRRLRCDDLAYLIKEGLGAGEKRGVRSLRHLPGDNILRRTQSRPVVVGQPERHLHMENIE